MKQVRGEEHEAYQTSNLYTDTVFICPAVVFKCISTCLYIINVCMFVHPHLALLSFLDACLCWVEFYVRVFSTMTVIIKKINFILTDFLIHEHIHPV